MAQRSFPFDAGAGATINETDWQNLARRLRQIGVIGGSLSQLAVSADGSALAVSVATGDAFVEGFFYRNDAALALTIAAANATNPRIDTVVVRLDRTANTAALAVVTGTAATSPVAPTLSQTDSLYELPLANVRVPAAAGVITAADVTDRRKITQTFDSAAYVAKGDVAATTVAAFESTTSTAYADLTTVGPSRTVTIGPSGRALVFVSARQITDAGGNFALTSYAISGATTRAAGDANSLFASGGSSTVNHQGAQVFEEVGLAPGSTTFTLKYRASAGTATFERRRIVVIPL